MTSQKAAALAGMVSQGAALHQAGRLEEARALYKKVLQRDPRHFDALHLLGVAAIDSGQTELGVALVRRAIAAEPGVAAAHANLAKALNDLGRPAEAVAAADRAIALEPAHADAHNNRGAALNALGRSAEAVAAYDRALAARPGFAEAWSNRGAAHTDLKQPAEALADFDRAIALRPAYAEAHNNRAAALIDLARFEEALAACDHALALRPGYGLAHNNRGDALLKLGRPIDAIAAFDSAIALNPAHAEAHYNRGVALHELGRLDEEARAYDTALALRPDYVNARINRAISLLLTGKLAEGFAAFEARKGHWPAGQRQYPGARPWTGGPIPPGERLFLYPEQGLGDTIQMARYLPLLTERGIAFDLAMQDPLIPLIQPLVPQTPILGRDAVPPRFEHHASIIDLPLAFGTTLETVPSPGRYLASEPARRARFEAILGPRDRPRIGLAWSGNPDHKNDRNRSIAFERLRPLLDHDARWVALQNDIRPADRHAFEADGRVSFHGDALSDFADTAALADLLDLVITVDTSLAHLAGALGKPVWILLPHIPDWRWLLGRDDSPWHPTARLFRQPEPGDWTAVIDRVKAALS